MATITHEHLKHMARRHHATMQELDKLTAKWSGLKKGTRDLIETGAAAWLGGAMEGRLGPERGKLGPVPLNLGLGVVFLALSHTNIAEKKGFADHLTNVGNGFVGSYLAAAGYKFGDNRRVTGKWFGGGSNPWLDPYANAPLPATTAGQWSPDPSVPLSPEQMAVIAQRLSAAAAG